ncbi:redoxin domain-containing protein, partial [bacterium]|nr:redoxin domain-containing protein [bacterium]
TQNLRMSRGGINSPTTESFALQTDQLTIGDMPLDFEGVTFSTSKKSRRFASKMARNRKRPVLLYFFTLISADSGAQMDWAETLYPKYKDKNVYIFCVTDDKPEFLKWYLEQGKWKVAVLRDENSLMHHDLEVDIHPYIILLDHWGVVRTISRGYNEESLKFVESVMDEIIDEANRTIALEKTGGPPIHKN